MIRILKNLILCCLIGMAGCNTPYPGVPQSYHTLLDSALLKAGGNAPALQSALAGVPESQREAMAYLIAYMPDYDLTSVSAEMLIDNVKYAYIARNEYSWCKNLPDSVFFNEVLPYHNVTEQRDNWRKAFYDRFSPYVKECSTLKEAIYAVNRNIRDELLVDYNTKRRASDQGPFESIDLKMASCTGLSILLTDAFRAVGIPARFAGTNNWFDNRGNHSWAEVLIDGQWYFTEYYMEDLDRAWFATDAAKATAGSTNNGIFAVSYKPTGTFFPSIWDENKHVNAIEVTPRYLDVCAYAIERKADDKRIKLSINGFNAAGFSKNCDNRIPVDITLKCKGKQIGGGTTCNNREDLNNTLSFLVEPDEEYTIVCVYDSVQKTVTAKAGSKDMTVAVVMD